MTSTATTGRDTVHRPFAAITSRLQNPEEAGHSAPWHYRTCGHDDPKCPAIKPDSNRLRSPYVDDRPFSLAAYCEAAEWFDGEATHEAPIPCKVCAR